MTPPGDVSQAPGRPEDRALAAARSGSAGWDAAAVAGDCVPKKDARHGRASFLVPERRRTTSGQTYTPSFRLDSRYALSGQRRSAFDLGPPR